jgi:hypothetical protein
MPDTINTLEADRAKLLEDFLRRGDLRPADGSLERDLLVT